MRTALLFFAVIGLVGVGAGCSRSLDRQRASYHEYKAERAAANGHYYKAAEHEAKANTARREAAHDPLP